MASRLIAPATSAAPTSWIASEAGGAGTCSMRPRSARVEARTSPARSTTLTRVVSATCWAARFRPVILATQAGASCAERRRTATELARAEREALGPAGMSAVRRSTVRQSTSPAAVPWVVTVTPFSPSSPGCLSPCLSPLR